MMCHIWHSAVTSYYTLFVIQNLVSFDESSIYKNFDQETEK